MGNNRAHSFKVHDHSCERIMRIYIDFKFCLD